MALNKSQIRSANDKRFTEVEVPEWGGSVRLGSFSAQIREELEMAMLARRNGDSMDVRGYRVQVVLAAAVDDAGSRLFTEDDATWLSDKDGVVLDRLADAALEHNGMGEDAAKAAQGNSGGEPGGASSTGSPSVLAVVPSPSWPSA